MERTSEVLNRAADLIEERGWAQGPAWDWYGDGSALCLEGAIGIAAGIPTESTTWQPHNECPAGVAVREYLGLAAVAPYPRTVRDGSQPLWTWNDEATRTAAEVIEVLRAAALIEQAKEQTPADAEAVVSA
jgi:hypothetical protein